jgi:hypothetical protein
MNRWRQLRIPRVRRRLNCKSGEQEDRSGRGECSWHSTVGE